jgi:tRNA A-37 threonylcarbamoyl transferase component Bud32
MLSAADAALAKRDGGISGLATVLDPDALADELRRAWGQSIELAELTYLRYKPATNCIAAFRVRVDGRDITLYAKAHGSDAAGKLRKAIDVDSAQRNGACERLVLEAQGVVVFAFPDDAKLGVLSRLADPERRRALLTRILTKRGVVGDEPVDALSYKPERRYVGRIQPANGEPAALKFYAPEGYPSAIRGCRAFESREVLRIAKKCGGSKRHRVLAFEWLYGRPLREAFSDDRIGTESVSKVGAALAELHAQPGEKLLPLSQERYLAKLDELASTLVVLCPEISDLARSQAERIATHLAESQSRRAIHGDLYDKQILLDGDRVEILDMDQAALGDPRLDLGQFLAHLERDSLQGKLARTRIDELRGWLLEGYQQVTGSRVDGLDAYVADSLFRLAHHPFRSHEPGWPGRTEQILSRVEEILATC